MKYSTFRYENLTLDDSNQGYGGEPIHVILEILKGTAPSDPFKIRWEVCNLTEQQEILFDEYWDLFGFNPKFKWFGEKSEGYCYCETKPFAIYTFRRFSSHFRYLVAQALAPQ